MGFFLFNVNGYYAAVELFAGLYALRQQEAYTTSVFFARLTLAHRVNTNLLHNQRWQWSR